MIRKLCILCILLILIFHGFANSGLGQVPEEIKQAALRVGKLLGPKPTPNPPSWATPNVPALFSFAWLTDMHLDGANENRMAQTLRWIDQELKPTFLLLTGDNSAMVPSGPAGADPAARNLRRQQYLQQWLAKHWKRPYAIIPGDNWPGEFDRVFGPRQYRIACGGLHLVLLAPDAIHPGPGLEGLSAFDPETLDWLRRDLEKYRGHPTLVAIHEPIYPPTFVDAAPIRKILQQFPQVVGVLQGHLHIDMQLRDGRQVYLVGPAVGPGQPPAFKLVRVYRHGMIIRTAEGDPKTGRWDLVAKWQKIDIPETLQTVLQPVEGAGQTTADPSVRAGWPGREKPLEMISFRPARPVRDDPSLARRAGELLPAIREFLWKEGPMLLMEAAGR